MENKIITTKIEVYSYNELEEDDQILVQAAKNATKTSYSPYSGFQVGAALLLDDGTVCTGSNQENVAYPSGLCAERTTIFAAAANHPGKKFKKLAIAAFTRGEFVENPVSPCGACRQAILEYEKLGGEAIEILLVGRDKVYKIIGIRALLPLCFDEF